MFLKSWALEMLGLNNLEVTQLNNKAMKKYLIEYWKCGLPHKFVVRYANNINSIRNIEWNNGVIVHKWQCD